ncbi:MAG: hypothetical protein M0Z52_05965 [Actinomycetota bacterium]|nr:hypothetical protein [Actinomycetota bacterium]
MKKILVLAAFVLAFAFAPMAMAQDSGMMNAPAAGLPTLTGPQSDNFEAASNSDAQSVCDQVAGANNKTSCTAIKNEAPPENVVTYHCECK